jgi:Peptidase family M28
VVTTPERLAGTQWQSTGARGGDRISSAQTSVRRASRRARRGSVERPINGRLVRAALLAVAVAAFVAGFSIVRQGPLPTTELPPAFDGRTATALAAELGEEFPSRVPGTLSAQGAADWYRAKLALYGLNAIDDSWTQDVAGLGKVALQNLATVVPGASDEAILIVAHRDNRGEESGGNDNASGTAALIELVRAYSAVGTVAARPEPAHTLIFLSSDGGAYGGYGAERFATTSPLRIFATTAVSLDGIAGTAQPRLEIAGFEPASPAPALTRTMGVRVAEQIGREPARPNALAQLVDLGIPFGYGEQGALLRAGISALRLTTAPDTPPERVGGPPNTMSGVAFQQLGNATAATIESLDAGVALPHGSSPSLYLGERVVPGWAVELVLLASLVPFLVGTIDLFAHSRRRTIRLGGAWRVLRTRIGLWLWLAAVVFVGALTDVLPRSGGIPPTPGSGLAARWPVAALALAILLASAGWLVARRRHVQRREADATAELAGYVVALVALGIVAIGTAIVNPFALLFLMPSLYAWLWLPQVQARSSTGRDVLYGIGLLGPVLAVVSLGEQLRLGVDAPLYALTLFTTGFVPWPAALLLLAWCGVATQLGALVAGRYHA